MRWQQRTDFMDTLLIFLALLILFIVAGVAGADSRDPQDRSQWDWRRD